MDGKLTGRLSQRRQLTGRLSVMPRVGPGAVLIPKTISENGIYRAADGFITVTKDNAGTAALKTYLFRLPDLINE